MVAGNLAVSTDGSVGQGGGAVAGVPVPVTGGRDGAVLYCVLGLGWNR